MGNPISDRHREAARESEQWMLDAAAEWFPDNSKAFDAIEHGHTPADLLPLYRLTWQRMAEILARHHAIGCQRLPASSPAPGLVEALKQILALGGNVKARNIAIEALRQAEGGRQLQNEYDEICANCGKAKGQHMADGKDTCINAAGTSFKGTGRFVDSKPSEETPGEKDCLECDCGVDPKRECFIPPWAHAEDCPYRTQKPRHNAQSALGEKGNGDER